MHFDEAARKLPQERDANDGSDSTSSRKSSRGSGRQRTAVAARTRADTARVGHEQRELADDLAGAELERAAAQLDGDGAVEHHERARAGASSRSASTWPGRRLELAAAPGDRSSRRR